jgi:NADPH:quinone reductase-like Zn-dependent oxidoreductase
MPCPEWSRLMDRYCALVKTYSGAVIELKDAHGTEFDQRREHADVLRVVAQQARLNKLAELFDSAQLLTDVGTVLSMEEARAAHEMLGGALHKRGKIVLRIAD